MKFDQFIATSDRPRTIKVRGITAEGRSECVVFKETTQEEIDRLSGDSRFRVREVGLSEWRDDTDGFYRLFGVDGIDPESLDDPNGLSKIGRFYIFEPLEEVEA